MRKVLLQEFVSLDARAAAPDGGVDFVPASTSGDDALGEGQLALIATVDAILLGRVTYEMFAAYWPCVSEGSDKPFADRLNAIPKIVFSRTLERAPWGDFDPATIVRDRAEQEVPKLARQSGKNMIVWGSISLAQSLINAGLIDEYLLVVCPLVLGGGRPLFDDNVSAPRMRLLGARAHDLGSVLLHYVPEQMKLSD